jgi:peptide/nickel transport system substrate-binding protein
VFNTMPYQNPKLDKIITKARFAESTPLYDSSVREMVQIADDELPRIPIFQPREDVAMRQAIRSYPYRFHRQPDCRRIFKA